jgi:hypothetical protein
MEAGGLNGLPPVRDVTHIWATLGRSMPDYEARREALRRLGRQIVW